MKKGTYLLIALVFFAISASAQSHQIDKKNSQLSIMGTSSLHDWACVVEKFSGSAEITRAAVSNISFEAAAKSIKSGKGGMDKNIYKALKTDKHSKITFVASSLKVEGDKLTGEGQLTIAGTTNTIPVELKYNYGDRVLVTGEISLKMTDYKVDPPTAMFGTIKTGDDITLEFTFSLITK